MYYIILMLTCRTIAQLNRTPLLTPRDTNLPMPFHRQSYRMSKVSYMSLKSQYPQSQCYILLFGDRKWENRDLLQKRLYLKSAKATRT